MPNNHLPEAQRREIERRFRSTLTHGALIPAGSLVVVGVSGGPDSAALLLLLQIFSSVLSYGIEAAYFDHEIRSMEERSAERASVRRLAGLAGVALHEGSRPVPALARLHRRSLEEQARIARYEFLLRVAVDRGAGSVAVGHTSDDQAETVLLHVLRGSGLRGLAGMRLRQPWPLGEGPVLVRPLLPFSHKETKAYCDIRSFIPHLDNSNASAAHLRNRIRHDLLPMLRSFNPNVSAALVKLARAAQEQIELLDRLVDQTVVGSAHGANEPLQIPLDVLADAPAAIRIEILARAYSTVSRSRRGLTARHLAALSLLCRSTSEHSIDLSGGIRARLHSGALLIERRPVGGTRNAAPLPETLLLVPGRTCVGPWEFITEVVEEGTLIQPAATVAALAASETQGLIVARSRRPGDRISPIGLVGSKKIQDILVDARVPRTERDQVPIVCLDDEVVWVVGHRRDARADVRSAEGRRIRLSAIRLDEKPT